MNRRVLSGLSFVIGGIIVCAANLAAAAEYPNAKMLVEPRDVADRKLPANSVILDMREKAKYDAGHVPGAVWIDARAWGRAFGDGSDADGWSKRIGEAGIAPGAAVVVYGDQLGGDVFRIWFMLRYWGVEDARVLNAGWKGWQAAGLPTETTAHAAKPAEFRARPRQESLATKQEVIDSVGGARRQIVDARSFGEFCGTDLRSNKRGGAIPGAKHLDWVNLIEQDSQRFKSRDDLQRLFADAGIDPAKPAVTHCQSGGRSSVMTFALELMGGNDVSNYYRGWSEWGNADDTSIEPGKPEAVAPK